MCHQSSYRLTDKTGPAGLERNIVLWRLLASGIARLTVATNFLLDFKKNC